MTDASHPGDRDPERAKADRLGSANPGSANSCSANRGSANPGANPMPNGLVLGEPGRRWRLFSAMVAAVRATRLPVLVVGSGPEAVRGLSIPVLSGLPMSVAGRPGETRSYRRAIERFLDGDPVEAGAQSGAARRTAEGRVREGRVREEAPGSPAGERVSGRGGAAAVLAPVGTGVGEVAWFLLREAHARLRPAGAVAAGWTPAGWTPAGSGPSESGPSGSVPIGGVTPDGAMPDGRASADGVPHEQAPGPVTPKGPPPNCPLPEADRPRALVVLDDAAGWPDPRGRVGMLLTGAASLGLQVWAGADGDEALIEALGVGMAAVLTEAGTVVDLRGSAA